MAISDLITEVRDNYGKEYLNWFFMMLTNPAEMVAKSRQVSVGGGQSKYLLIVLMVSVFIGATIGALIPNRPPIQDRMIVFVVVTLLWLFLSLLVHYFCRLMGGKEDAQITVSLMTQNLAFAYVGSNFLTLLIMWMEITYKPVQTLFASREFVQNPGGILFALQFLILLYIVPLTVSYAHGFRGYKWFGVAVFSAFFAVLFGVPVYAQHGC